MVDITKLVYGTVWADAGEKLSPIEEKIQSGWVQEMMPYQYENFLQNRQDVAITYLFQKGVPEWSSEQEYIANKSVVTYAGQMYMALLTNTNTLPTVSTSWKRLTINFAPNGAVPISFGGTGATSAADARTNLGIGTIATANSPVTNGLLVKLSDNTLVTRAVSGTAGYITVTNGDGTSGNPIINVGVNVAKTDADASWSTTGSIKLPSGSTSEQGIATPGRVRFNLETDEFQGAYSGGWNVLAKPATAAQTPIVDTGGYYSSTNVEGALQYVGETLSNAILAFPDYTAASAAAVTLPDGQAIDVDSDKKRYRVNSGILVFDNNLDQLRIDLLDSSGASRVGYKQPIGGATQRAAQDKLAEKLSVYDLAGADGTGATDSTAAIQASIDSIFGRDEIDLVGGTFTVGDISNPRGVHLSGGTVRRADPHGGFVQVNTYADDGKTFIGKEYLYRLFLRMRVGGDLTGYLFGDSTVATAANGGVYNDTNYEPQKLLVEYLVRTKGVRNNINLFNFGVGGTRVSQMDATPYISYSGTTDLFIIKYGINDAQDGFDGFATNLRQKLAEIRAHPYGGIKDLAVILIGPNSTYDPGHGRSSTWYEKLRGIYVQAARDYGCAYFDTYAHLLRVDWTADNLMDNPFGDGQTVHPLDIMQNMIWGGMIDSAITDSEMTPYASDAWKALTMLNGWEYYGSGFAEAEVSMSRDGWVSLRGLIKSGTVGVNTAVAQISDNIMHPKSVETFVVTTATGTCSLRVNIDGKIEQQDGNASATYTSLSGIRFKARG